MVSLSVLLQVLILPVMGAVADYTHLKKRIMGLFAYIGAFATMGLYFVGDQLLWAGCSFWWRTSALAPPWLLQRLSARHRGPNERDRVSSIGWAIGYLGGGLLLALNLVFYSLRDSSASAPGDAVRISLASAGLWWALFTLIPLFTLRNRQPRRAAAGGEHYMTVGFKQLGHTLRQLPAIRRHCSFWSPTCSTTTASRR